MRRLLRNGSIPFSGIWPSTVVPQTCRPETDLHCFRDVDSTSSEDIPRSMLSRTSLSCRRYPDRDSRACVSVATRFTLLLREGTQLFRYRLPNQLRICASVNLCFSPLWSDGPKEIWGNETRIRPANRRGARGSPRQPFEPAAG